MKMATTELSCCLAIARQRNFSPRGVSAFAPRQGAASQVRGANAYSRAMFCARCFGTLSAIRRCGSLGDARHPSTVLPQAQTMSLQLSTAFGMREVFDVT
jgi:hypothetical protein